MTPGMRLARYAAIGLCAFAQTAPAVPNRVPEPTDPPPVLIDETTPPPRTAEFEAGARSNWVLHDTLAKVFDPGARGRLPDDDGAPVAEPSTLLLVSFGLFGLILWNRRRR